MSDRRNAQDIGDGRKSCSRCRKVLPLTAFTPKPHLRSGLDSWCGPRRAANNRVWRAKRRAAGA